LTQVHVQEENRPTILAVDDDPDIHRLWERYLSAEGCRFVAAGGGLQALELVQQERPAAIVLDVTLPDIDGWQVLQALKSDVTTKDIPVVMCSGLEERGWSLAMGADGYMRKPVTRRVFRSALERVGVI